MTERIHVFGVGVTVPDDLYDRYGTFEFRPLIDGADFIEGQSAYPYELTGAVCGEPRTWLAPGGPLWVGEEPHLVEMAYMACDCHSALDVAMWREGGTVVWDWRAATEDFPAFGEYRFDAAQYDAEVERASRDFSWEWPAMTVARLLGERLRSRPEWLSSRSCELDRVWAELGDPERVRLLFTHYERRADGSMCSAGAFGAFRPVTGEDPAVQAERLAAEFLSGDPRAAQGVRSDPSVGPLFEWLGTGYSIGGPSAVRW
ncbi:hypothetical protein ACFWBX_06925 [Streptomyces sp. NPDC059991]|uniref:hypothetical protein n=1 Tax=Streptomyces sp. NPDC059991 TaxID=3347028 RepID=UPI0036C581F7